MKKQTTKKARRTAWTDGDPPPTGSAIVATFSVEGVTYERRFTACGKERCRKGCASGVPSHGPYWYSYVWEKDPKTGKAGKTKARYVGKDAPKLETLASRPEMRGRL